MVSQWQRQVAMGTIKSFVPFPNAMRRVLRAVRPYRTNPKNDESLLHNALSQAQALRDAGLALRGATVVEIGTGWNPILPIVFHMAGAAKIVSVDQHRLLDGNSFRVAVEYITQNLDRIVQRESIDPALIAANAVPSATGSFSDFCNAIGLEYLAPFDFRDLNSGIADAIVSRTVLEHIPEDKLRGLLLSAGLILKPTGLMCHDIDMSDHFEHLDKSISRLNFLRFEEPAWNRITRDPQLYQNRLRRFELLAMIDGASFRVVSASGAPNEMALHDLESLPICSRYRGVAHEELAILETRVVAKSRRVSLSSLVTGKSTA